MTFTTDKSATTIKIMPHFAPTLIKFIKNGGSFIETFLIKTNDTVTLIACFGFIYFETTKSRIENQWTFVIVLMSIINLLEICTESLILLKL